MPIATRDGREPERSRREGNGGRHGRGEKSGPAGPRQANDLLRLAGDRRRDQRLALARRSIGEEAAACELVLLQPFLLPERIAGVDRHEAAEAVTAPGPTAIRATARARDCSRPPAPTADA